jgi:hypothetical protein
LLKSAFSFSKFARARALAKDRLAAMLAGRKMPSVAALAKKDRAEDTVKTPIPF